MRPLTAAELLSVWERARSRPPVERALALLAAACPGETPDELARLGIGRRDARLMTLREWSFGPRLVSLAACPACGERVELDFEVADLRVGVEEPAGPVDLQVDGYELRLRLPDSRDLAVLGADPDPRTLRRRLLGRCLLAARQDGQEVEADRLPPGVEEAVAKRMAEADPQADVELALSCPKCGGSWLAAFDIVTFFWREIEAWAVRLLREVHTLASAYGWREADILALSPLRRQLYLQMVGG